MFKLLHQYSEGNNNTFSSKYNLSDLSGKSVYSISCLTTGSVFVSARQVKTNGYNSQQSEAYGAPDYFADGYQENVFEGNLNLADTPWTETAVNPNPHFDSGEINTNSYFGGDDLEL